MEEGLFPSSQSLYSMEDLEEERRLFYVAITRAEKKLYLTYATSRYKFGNIQYGEASRFLKELPMGILSFFGQQKQSQPADTGGSLKSSFSKTLLRQQTAAPTAKLPSSGEPFIPDDVSNLQMGAEVVHEKFGEGKVILLEGNAINRIATIFFPNFGEKKIMLKFAKLKIVSST
jgi:DNA helicase-2/ATP-dependent DNA helicase PcrA